jgi:hypothetical protein
MKILISVNHLKDYKHANFSKIVSIGAMN